MLTTVTHSLPLIHLLLWPPSELFSPLVFPSALHLETWHVSISCLSQLISPVSGTLFSILSLPKPPTPPSWSILAAHILLSRCLMKKLNPPELRRACWANLWKQCPVVCFCNVFWSCFPRPQSYLIPKDTQYIFYEEDNVLCSLKLLEKALITCTTKFQGKATHLWVMINAANAPAVSGKDVVKRSNFH